MLGVGPLRPLVPPLMIDIAAPNSVAHFGPVEVLCLTVGRPPTTRGPLSYRYLESIVFVNKNAGDVNND